MSEIQHELFDADPAIDALIDRLDEVPDDTLRRKWPALLAALLDVLDSELQRNKVSQEDARRLSRKQAAAIAAYLGGRNYYLPVGETLFTALRDDEIFEKWFNGADIESLRREYGLAQMQIYHVIKQQRQLHRRRNQPDLFPA